MQTTRMITITANLINFKILKIKSKITNLYHKDFTNFAFNHFKNSSRLPLVYHKKKHETLNTNSPIKIYVNKIKNSTVFKIKTRYTLKLQKQETMRLLGSTEKRYK